MIPPAPAMPASDGVGDWLTAARGGSADALGQLLECCRLYLLHVANAELDPRLRPKASASDLVQDTFVEAQRIFGRFHGASSEELRGWLCAILRNKLATFTRSYRDVGKRRASREVDLASSAGPTELVGPQSTPSSLMIHGEQATALTAALNRLPDHYRQVIVWRQLEDLSFAEMAGRLGRTEAAVRKLWWRALQHLHQELGDSL